MKEMKRAQNSAKPTVKRELMISAKSGLRVNVYDDVWTLLPNKGKGWQVFVDWVHSGDMPTEARVFLLDVFKHYARTKQASTTATIVINVKPFMTNGIPLLSSVKAIWSGLQTSKKKGLNQFFGTLSKLGNKRFDDYHQFTKTHLDKEVRNHLDPSKGALSDMEFDSLAKQVNNKIQDFSWCADRDISFYQSSNYGFGEYRNSVAIKLLTSIVRRPIQVILLKWADTIPSGASFQDVKIHTADEIGTVGAETLQLRVFHAKTKGNPAPRASPERYPIHLSEGLSKTLIDYKKIYLKGLTLLLDSAGIKATLPDLLSLMNDMPMFPETNIFGERFDSLDLFRSLFTPDSTAYHVSESSISNGIRYVRVTSDRSLDCTVTSNRIRHTVLTRGAQAGLPATQLAMMTGVTVPAARHYVDLDYKSRQQIDSKYIGNEFLRKAFSGTIILVPGDDEYIVDQQFNNLGGPCNERVCRTCPTVLGMPLGCYGCPNFRPILEADHRGVLGVAEDKLAVNLNSLINPLYSKTIEKLERQIIWVKLTIELCDEILAKQRAIDAE